jgi:thiamine biosynthesis lipoprotein
VKLFRLCVVTVALLAASLAGCQRDMEHSTQLYVFGTLVEVKLWGATAEQANQAFGELQQLFRRLHRGLHAWEPGPLTAVNQAFAAGESAGADEHIVEMVRRSQELERRSGGRFNPAIGALIRLWGFHTSDYPVTGPPPTSAEIDRILQQRPSSREIVIDGQLLRTDNSAVQLDFGGIAKGYAVDLAVQSLRARGIENAIVNAGGDLRAIGRHGERPWRVAVRKPGGGVIGAVEVRGDESLFTSGNYERFRQDATERYPHILDPRSGWPVEHVASVTVIAAEGVLADAAATALVVAGLDEWPGVAAALGLDQVMVIDEDGTVFLTPAMEQRVRFTETLDPVVVELELPGP